MTQSDERPPNSVWYSCLDERYDCEVLRLEGDPYSGVLKVTDQQTENVLLEKFVTISYAAAFGPDIADVVDWEDACVAAVDGKKEE